MTEFRPGRFQILPTVIKNLIIINVLVFIAQLTFSGAFNFLDAFALHTWQSPLFKPWQFFTYLFLHDTRSWDHILGNMFALWMFGSTLENLWGPKRFLSFYIACGLGAALCHMIVLYIENQPMVNQYQAMDALSQQFNSKEYFGILNSPTLGASGAVFGCLAAFGYLFANQYVYLYFFIPIKVKWFVLGYTGFELYEQIRSSAGDNVAHVAHLGGALVGFLLAYFWNKNNRRKVY
jgi:membrane associated rhomboid family serine protease